MTYLSKRFLLPFKGGYLHQIIGYVTDELIRRGVLRKPDAGRALTDGVFYVEGKYIHP